MPYKNWQNLVKPGKNLQTPEKPSKTVKKTAKKPVKLGTPCKKPDKTWKTGKTWENRKNLQNLVKLGKTLQSRGGDSQLLATFWRCVVVKKSGKSGSYLPPSDMTNMTF